MVGHGKQTDDFIINVGSGPPGLHLATLALRDPRGFGCQNFIKWPPDVTAHIAVAGVEAANLRRSTPNGPDG